MSTEDPTVVLGLTGAHFGCILATICYIAIRGDMSQILFISVAISLSMASIAMLPFWVAGESYDGPMWSVGGSWGFIVLNYIFLLYAAYGLDGYVGAERDLLGRALSRTAGKVLRAGKRSVIRENEASSRRVVRPPKDSPNKNLESSSGNSASVIKSIVGSGNAQLQSANQQAESVALGGPSGFTRPPSSSMSSDEEDGADEENLRDSKPVALLDEIGADADDFGVNNTNKTKPNNDKSVASRGFEIIAQVLPRRIFYGSQVPPPTLVNGRSLDIFDEATSKLIGMGKDIGAYVTHYKRWKMIEAAGWYFLSLCTLITMGVLQQIATGGKVRGWFNVGWIVLGDSILLLLLVPAGRPLRRLSSPDSTISNFSSNPTTTTTTTSPPQATSPTAKFRLMRNTSSTMLTRSGEENRPRNDDGWIAAIPSSSLTPPLWVLMTLLLACRALLMTVPPWFNFASQCFCYIICATYLSYILLRERFRGGKWMRTPAIILLVFNLWLMLDSTLLGISNIYPEIAITMDGGSRSFYWDSNSPPLKEWILGVASFTFVGALVLIYVAVRFYKKSAPLWIGVYLLLCLTGFALDCLAEGGASIELGVFVSVSTLTPVLALVLMAFKETISAAPPRPRLLVILTLAFGLEIGWAFSLQAANSNVISFFVFIAALEFHALVCYAHSLAMIYNCVFTNWTAYAVLAFGVACYLAVLPVGYGLASTKDPYTNDFLATTIISFVFISCIASFAWFSMLVPDLGWESMVTWSSARPKMRFKINQMRLTLFMAMFLLAAVVALTVQYYPEISGIWLGTITLLLLYFISAIQARIFEKPISPRAMNFRVVFLTLLALVLFALAVVDGSDFIAQKLILSEGAFYAWTHFLITGFVLLTYAVLEFSIAIFDPLPNQILSPSEALFGLPIVRYSIERKGGEIFIHNLHVLTCLGCFVILDVIGFIVALVAASKPWGTVLSSAAFCLVSLLGFELKSARIKKFRSDLSRVNVTSDVAEDAFAHVLRDTVGKIRQFSTRTVMFDSDVLVTRVICPSQHKLKLKREDKQKSLAFFFCLFNLALKRKMRMVNQEEQFRLRAKIRMQERAIADPAASSTYSSSSRMLLSQREKIDEENEDDLNDEQEQPVEDRTSKKGPVKMAVDSNKVPVEQTLVDDGVGRGEEEEKSMEIKEMVKSSSSILRPQQQRYSDDSSNERLDEKKKKPKTSRTPSKPESSLSIGLVEGESYEDAEHGEGDVESQNRRRSTLSSSRWSQRRRSSPSGGTASTITTITTSSPKEAGTITQQKQQQVSKSTARKPQQQPLATRYSSASSSASTGSTSHFMFVDESFPPHPSLVLEEWDEDLAAIVQDNYQELFLWLRPSEICANRAWGLRVANEEDPNDPHSPAIMTPRHHQHHQANNGHLSSSASTLSSSRSAKGRGVDARQVQQGTIADCWLLSALSVVALKHALFDRVLPAKTKSADGRYVVRLFDFVQGDWMDVTIDDCLPCDVETRKPLFGSSKSGNVFWVSLVEKAFAKRQGGWPMLSEGQVHRALVDLTGGFSQLFSFQEDFELVESGALWNSILSLTRAGQLLVLGSKTNADEFGLVPEHAYAVLSVVEVHDSRGRHRLMQLQDPWGRTEWKGKWSDVDTKRWSPRAKSTVDANSELTFASQEEDDDSDHNNADDQDDGKAMTSSSNQQRKKEHRKEEGTFWMEFDDVAMLFKWLFACRIFQDRDGWIHRDIIAEWTPFTAGGPPDTSLTVRNPQFLLQFHPSATTGTQRREPPNRTCRRRNKAAVVFISICNLEENLVYPYMSLLLLHLGGAQVNGPVLASQVVASTGKYKDARELSIEVALPLDKSFTLLPSLARPGELGKFRLSIHAKVPFELTRLN